MYEIWAIHDGIRNLIDQQRDPVDAQSRALEASGLHRDWVIVVIRQGFGNPLYYAVAGSFVGDVLEVVRFVTTPTPPVVISETTPLLEDATPRRKRGPSERKSKGGKPDCFKAFPTTVTAIDEEQGIVEAIVNVFGIVDDGDDIVHSGAFIKTLAENGMRVKVLDSHNNRSALSVVGKPLDIREVGRDELPAAVRMKYPGATGGLYTQTQYLLSTPEGRGVFERIKAGALNEYSIGFDALDTTMERMQVNGETKVVRNIRQVRLWEYSPVIWGMNPATATSSVKSADGETDTALDTDIEPNDETALAPDESKSGRVLSAANFSKIEQAFMLLQEVMQSAMPAMPDGTTGDDEMMSNPVKQTDGPQETTEAPTSDATEAGSPRDDAPDIRKQKLLETLQQRLAEMEG